MQGRVKDEGNVKVKTALRRLVDELNLTMVLSPTQSVIFKDIAPADRGKVDAILKECGIDAIEQVDPLTRLSMACPALPLCGLAVTEAERRMPDWVSQTRTVLNRIGLDKDEIMLRMTGCPNGCARPYMAEFALVGDGPDMYQVWVGGTPNLTRLGQVYADKVKYNQIDTVMENLFTQWRDQRVPHESFGDFAARTGVSNLVKAHA